MDNAKLQKFNTLKQEIISEIKPTEYEQIKLEEVTRKLINHIYNVIKKRDLKDISVQLVGSAARNTWLSGTHDLDIFIVFPENTSREELEAIGLEIARDVTKIADKYEERFAEHPYINLQVENFGVDLVPCFGVSDSSKIKSSVDRTPFHNEYVKSNIAGLFDDVRLLKQFMRGIGVYGSELKTKGFSGYLTELLVIYYGSFENVLYNAANWKPGIKLRLGNEEISTILIQEKKPLLFVDPIDPERNVASAVSLDKLCEFIDAARDFLESPSKQFFFSKKGNEHNKEYLIDRMERRSTGFIVIIFDRPDEVDDVVYPQLYKMERSVTEMLEMFDFKVMKSFSWSEDVGLGNKSVVFFELITSRLPNVKKHFGPPVWLRDHAQKFKEKYSDDKNSFNFYIEDGKYVCDVLRQHVNAKSLLEDRLKTCSLGKHINESINQNFDLLENDEVLKIKNPEFRLLLSKSL